MRRAVLPALAAVCVGLTACAGRTPPPESSTVQFVVALRTFEERDVALADQAIAPSHDPRLRAAAVAWARQANDTSAAIWVLLDRWGVPGVDRLPVADPSVVSSALAGPIEGIPAATAGLRYTCGPVANDELSELAELSGPTFDTRVRLLWTEDETVGLQALAMAPHVHAPGLGPILKVAARAMRRDLSYLASA